MAESQEKFEVRPLRCLKLEVGDKSQEVLASTPGIVESQESRVESGETKVESREVLASTPGIVESVGKGVCLKEGTKVAVLSIGAIGNTVAGAIEDLRLKIEDLSIAHYDMRWLKPIDTEILDYVGTHFKKVVTVEDGVISGGLGSAVLEYFADKGYNVHVTRLGINNQFVEHGSTKELYHMLHLDTEGICESLLQALEK